MSWRVPQNAINLGADYEAALASCLRRGWITEGLEAARFSDAIRGVTGARHVALAPNGTLALYLALRAAGVGQGHVVVVPDLTFIASATAVLMTGATPIFADVDERGLLTDGTALRALAPRERPKAVMSVHLFGFLAELSPAWTQRTDVVIEDACQALGGLSPEQFDERSCRVQALSFYADKAFTTGEGGAVATSDGELAERMIYIRNQGRLDRGSFAHPQVGINLRMTDLQCAIGAIQLGQFEDVRAARQRIWCAYREALALCDFARVLEPPAGQDARFVPFRVVLVFEEEVAHAVAAAMRRRGLVEPREMFMPMHLQPCFAHLRSRYAVDAFPGATSLWRRGLLLPCWPGLTDDLVGTVVGEVAAVYREVSRGGR